MKTAKGGLRELGIRKVGETQMGVSEYCLANGLKVLLCPNHSAPVLTYMQLFRVGSRDEGVGNTGATHFLEHMMFKGTRRFDPLKGLDSTELLNRIGAVSNATTWFDRTNYFETVPSEYLEFCIKVESDRMRNLRLRQSDRDSEMSVVRNELERGENSPDEAMEKEIYAIAYREHPYHHPTIGWRSDVENVSMERLKVFYDTFYWPNNCSIILVGDFEPMRALALISKYYLKIPRSPKPIPDVYTSEPPQEGERRFQIKRCADLARVWVAHKCPSSRHPDHYALNLISHLLGGSHDKSSRLYASLIDSGLAMSAACRHDELRDPALFMVACTLNPGASHADVESAVLRELQRLAEEPVSAEELAPIKSANWKGSILARADQMELAFAIGEAEARADWRWLATFDWNFDAVSSDDIMRVAREYFQKENRTVGHFLPQESEAADEDQALHGEPELENMDLEEMMEAESSFQHGNGKSNHVIAKLKAEELEKVLSPAAASKAEKLSGFASKIKSKTLANGLRFYHLESPGSGSLAVTLQVPVGNYCEPEGKHGLADVCAEMLQRGSLGLSKEELASKMKEMGQFDGLAFDSCPFMLAGGNTIVKEDLPAYLKLMRHVIEKPAFAESELDKLKLEWSGRITEQKNNTGPLAVNRFYRELYPEGHLYYQLDFDSQLKQLEKIGRGELLEFHKKYGPAGSVLTIVGDISFAEALELVGEIFADWKGEPPGKIELAAVPIPSKAKRVELPLPDKASMDILLGYPLPVKRSDPDFYPLYLANLALGGDTITSRLGKVVREQHGLTYSIHSSLGDNLYGAAPWTVSFSVNPANAEKALELVFEVLGQYKKKGITNEELKREASGAAGLFKVGLRSSMAIARSINRFHNIGIGPEGIDAHPAKIQQVKKKDVDAVIAKYLHPERMLSVLCGSF